MKHKWLSICTGLFLSAALAGCGGNQAVSEQPIVQESQESRVYISMETAQTTALDAAGVSASDAEISSSTLGEVAGITCYQLEFTAGNYAYSYSIDATSGAVLEASYLEISKDTETGENTAVSVETSETGNDGKDGASANAGTGSTAAQTGTGKANVAGSASGAGTSSDTAQAGAVDEAKAKEIALAHAGVNAANATFTKVKLDYADGRQVYEVEWYADGSKYDYEIAVSTGEVVSSGFESKKVTAGAAGVTVSEADAKQAALDRVPGATVSDIYEWEFDYDDGMPEYEGKIIYGGSEYEFTINAANGSITEWDAEVLKN